jgi:type 1 fimbria pilin
MKTLLFSLFAMFVLTGVTHAQTKEINDPNAEVRNVKGYHAIKVSNAIDLHLSQSNEEVVAVSASKEEYRSRIKTEIENGVLKIWYDNDQKWMKGDKKLRAYISFKTLDKLNASGASDVFVTGTIKSNDLEIHMSGASDFKGAIEANSLTVDLNGASDMTITGGSVTSLKIEASGASDFTGYDLQADNCSAKASGASDIKITVNKELSAEASGASGVHYKGNGVIRDVKTNGASSISKKS